MREIEETPQQKHRTYRVWFLKILLKNGKLNEPIVFKIGIAFSDTVCYYTLKRDPFEKRYLT